MIVEKLQEQLNGCKYMRNRSGLQVIFEKREKKFPQKVATDNRQTPQNRR
jgi:hypothetical protein